MSKNGGNFFGGIVISAYQIVKSKMTRATGR